MATARPLWARPCLCRISPLPSSRQSRLTSPRLKLNSPVSQPRRNLSSPATFQVPSEPTLDDRLRHDQNNGPSHVDQLLQAILAREPGQITESFLSWTDELADDTTPRYQDAIAELSNLPPPVFSEILRNVDPVQRADLDVANGMNLTPDLVRSHASAAGLVDEFGVRHHHRNVLGAILTLLDACHYVKYPLQAADYEVMARCAGAGLDNLAAKEVWASMAIHQREHIRTPSTWLEFLRSRFLIDPIYYQNDRSRVMVSARNLHSRAEPIPSEVLQIMDRIRFNANWLKREPWNRRRDEQDEDLRRFILRRTKNFRSFERHWVRTLFYGTDVDEKLLCSSMIALARSNSLSSILQQLLKRFYGISVSLGADGRTCVISGGDPIPSQSPIKPTELLLDAIVDSFGCMAQVPLGMKLLQYISERYHIDIPPSTWTKLLSWAYIGSAKPFSTLRRLYESRNPASNAPSLIAEQSSPKDKRRENRFAQTSSSKTTRTMDFWEQFHQASETPGESVESPKGEVASVWATMTEAPYKIQPSFEDYEVYIKSLILRRSYGKALTLINDTIMPLYQAAIQDHKDSVLDAALLDDTSSTQLAQRAELIRASMHHRISGWFLQLLSTMSRTRGSREGHIIQCLVPNVLGKYGTFFPQRVHYRTAQGRVELNRPDGDVSELGYEWANTFRKTLPQKYGTFVSREQREEKGWPMAEERRVLQLTKEPKKRTAEIPWDEPGEGHLWQGLLQSIQSGQR